MVDLAKFGSGHPELKLKEFRNPWQRAEVAPKLFSVSEPYTNYRKAVLELKLQHFRIFRVRDPIETKLADPGHLELKLQQFRNPWQPKLAQVGSQPMSHTYGDPRRRPA